MQRDNILALLKKHRQAWEKFGVARLALFGSFARDEASEHSDIDMLVRFAQTPTAKDYFGLQFYLEDLLGRPVDLVTEKSLRPELWPFVEKDLIDVA